jgi:hypothetical protein
MMERRDTKTAARLNAKNRRLKKALHAYGKDFKRHVQSFFKEMKVTFTEEKPRKGGLFRWSWDVTQDRALRYGVRAEVLEDGDEYEIIWTWWQKPHIKEQVQMTDYKTKATYDQLMKGWWAYEPRQINKALSLAEEVSLTMASERTASSLGNRELYQLLEMEIESSDYEDVAPDVSSEMMKARDKFEKVVERAIESWAKKNMDKFDRRTWGPDIDPRDVVGVLMEDGRSNGNAGYLYYMEHEGHGVGTWDGRWDHYLADKDIKNLSEHVLGATVREYSDLASAIYNTAYELAEEAHPGRYASRKTAMKPDQHPIDPRKGVMYFDLNIEDYNIDEDVEEALAGDARAAARLAEAFGKDWKADAEKNRLDVNGLESRGLKEVQKILKARIGNEGHDSGGSLVCNVNVQEYGDVKRLWDIVDDEMYDLVDTPYMGFSPFTLYPQGVNGPSFGSHGRNGDIDDWLDDNDPRDTRLAAPTRYTSNSNQPSPRQRRHNMMNAEDMKALLRESAEDSKMKATMTLDHMAAQLEGAWSVLGADDKDSEEKEGKFEKGKPADPTKNMTDAQKAEWEEQKDKNKDKFKSGSAKPKGLYGYTKGTQTSVEASIRKVQRKAASLAKALYKRDRRTASFLQLHTKRAKSSTASMLVAAMKGLGPFPHADGKTAAADYGLYGHNAKVARVCINACADLSHEIGRIAYDLHRRKAARHALITGFLKAHSKETKCAYAKILLASYPDSTVTAGCEKLPNEKMVENCEEKKEEAKKKDDGDKEAGCEKLPNEKMQQLCEDKKEEGKENKDDDKKEDKKASRSRMTTRTADDEPASSLPGEEESKAAQPDMSQHGYDPGETQRMARAIAEMLLKVADRDSSELPGDDDDGDDAQPDLSDSGWDAGEVKAARVEVRELEDGDLIWLKD